MIIIALNKLEIKYVFLLAMEYYYPLAELF
jgi:hypothetical protein